MPKSKSPLLRTVLALPLAVAAVLSSAVPSALAAPPEGFTTSAFATLPAGLDYPDQVVQCGGFVYVDDAENKIYKISPAGVVQTFDIGASVTSAPRAETCDPFGNVFVIDHGGIISKLSAAGVLTKSYAVLDRSTTPGFSTIDTAGIVSDHLGDLYVLANSVVGASRVDEIERVDVNGTVAPFFAVLGRDGEFQGSNGTSAAFAIASGDDSTMYVNDFADDSITRVSASGDVTRRFAVLTAGARPTAIVVDSSGNLYTANSGDDTISRIAPDGGVTASNFATLPPKLPGYLGATIDRFDTISVTNASASGLARVSHSGDVIADFADRPDHQRVSSEVTSHDGAVYTVANDSHTVYRTELSPSLTSLPPGGVLVGEWFSFQIAASGEGPIVLSTRGALPPGMNFDPATGILSGMVTTPAEYHFSIAATDRWSADVRDLTFVVYNAP